MLSVGHRGVCGESLLVGSPAQGGSYLRPCDLKQAVAFEPLVLDEMLPTFGNR